MVRLTEKNSFKHSISHFLFREFLKHATPDLKTELMESLKPLVVEILHTKDGARVAMECLWTGNAKDRKVIIKSFKKHVPQIVAEEHGYLVLLAAFDCVDDTKLLDKYILSELFSTDNALQLAHSKNGIHVLEYLLSPRDSRFFHRDIVNILSAGDKNPNSKKEQSIRVKELKETASPHLFKLVTDNALDLLNHNKTCLLATNILTQGVADETSVGDKREAMTAVVKEFANEGLYFEGKGGGNIHIIEKTANTVFLKKVLKAEKSLFEEKGKKMGSDLYLSAVFVELVSQQVLRSYVGCNRGCFLLLDLLQTEIPPVLEKVRSACKGLNKTLSEKGLKGADLLLEKLKSG
jgi:pumilio family protein 6